MNKKVRIAIIIFLIIFIIIGVYVFIKNSNSVPQEQNYEADRTSSENTQKQETNTSENSSTSPPSSASATNDTSQSTSQSTPQPPQNPITPSPTEEDISSFSTKIYSNDSNRTKNMTITASALNNKIVKNNETFSFCKTIGPSTSNKGYQKADIYDNNGKKKKGYGGGNCQVSSTLYNAVLAVPNLSIVERHPHSNKVPYVAKDKDAAVAYGSYDFKFKNSTGNDIKIYASINNGTVNITLKSIKYKEQKRTLITFVLIKTF